MDKPAKNFSLTGIIFSIIVTAGFIWAAVQLYIFWNGPGKLITQDMKSSELHAFLNLQVISQAQKKIQGNRLEQRRS